MEFRISYADVTDARCAACVMTGGVRIEDRDDAKAFSRVLERDVAVGEVLNEEPCENAIILTVIREKEGRPCPRVELDADNEVAANLASCLLQPRAQVAFGPMFYAMCGDEPRDVQRLVLLRAIGAVQSQPVSDALSRKPRGAE